MTAEPIMRIFIYILITGGITFPIPLVSIELFQKFPDSIFFLIFQLIRRILADISVYYLVYFVLKGRCDDHWMLMGSVPMFIAMLFMIALFSANIRQQFQPKWHFYNALTLVILAAFCLKFQQMYTLLETAGSGSGSAERFFKVIAVPVILLSVQTSVIFPCIMTKKLPRILSVWMWISVPMYSVLLILAVTYFYNLDDKYYFSIYRKGTRIVRMLYLIVFSPLMAFWIVRAIMLQWELADDNSARLYIIFSIIIGSWRLVPPLKYVLITSRCTIILAIA